MNKINKSNPERKSKISKELIAALVAADLPEDILEEVIFFLEMEINSSKKEKKSKEEIIFYLTPEQSPQETLGRTFARLDKLIERTEDMKSRVDLINTELQKLAYFS